MRPGESFIGQPIRSLQTMLRIIGENTGQPESLIPDGIYGPETVRAVSAFQRRHGVDEPGKLAGRQNGQHGGAKERRDLALHKGGDQHAHGS